MSTPTRLHTVKPPYAEGPPPPFCLLETIPLTDDLAPSDLYAIRERVAQAAGLVTVTGSIDTDCVELAVQELVVNAADIANEAVGSFETNDTLSLQSEEQTRQRHAIELVVGHTASEVIVGVRDSSGVWTRDPRRPGTRDPKMKAPGNVRPKSPSRRGSDRALERMTPMGRGHRLVRKLADAGISFTVEAVMTTDWLGEGSPPRQVTSLEKTVWPRFKATILDEVLQNMDLAA